jgi:hypothetical protein
MTITYRTAGAWGPGKGANLTAAEVDGNFHGLATRLVAVETNPAQPAQIEAITSSGSALTITMDNGDIYGPLLVPAAAFRFMGVWTPSTAYIKNDVVRYGNDVYYISADHTSGAEFLLTQTIGGVAVYQLMFDGDAAARSSVGPVFDNETHTGIGYNFDPVTGDVTSTVDFAVGRLAYFEAVRDFLLGGSHTGVSFVYDLNTQAVSATVEITQYSDELAQDAVAAALSAGTHAGISFSYNDAANSLSAAVSQIAFTGLSDVPTSYGGQAGKLVTVNPDGTGLEFTSANALVAVAAVPRFMGAQVNLVASTAAQNYAAGIAIPFGAEQYDTDGFHDTVSNPARMTIPLGLGIKKVKVSATVRVSAITAGSDNFLAIRKNGAEAYLGSPALHHENSAATSTTISVSSGAIPVVAGDYFECWFSTSDTSTGLEADRTSFSIEVVEVEGGINIANVQNDATTARTLGLADINAHLVFSSASAVTVTVPLNASVAFPIGSTIDLEQTGSGVVSVAGEAGVTVNKPAGRTAATLGQYAVIRLRKVALNTWTLFGELA